MTTETTTYVPKSFAEFRRNVQTFQLVQAGVFSRRTNQFMPFGAAERPTRFGEVRSIFEKRAADFQFTDGGFLSYGRSSEWTFAPGVATRTFPSGRVYSFVVTYSQEG